MIKIMFKTGDKYILQIFCLFFFSILIMGLSLYIAIDAIPSLTRYNPSFKSISLYYFYALPEIFLVVTPFACTIASFLCFYQLSKKKELLAFFSLGISFKRTLRPIICFLFLVCVFCLWLSDKVIPHFAQKKDHLYFKEIKKKPHLYSSFKMNKMWYRSPHIFFNIKHLNLKSSKAQEVTLYYFNLRNWFLSQITKAKEVEIQGKLWTLRNGRSTIFIPEADFPLTKTFSKKVIAMDESLIDLQSSSRSFENMSLKRMWKFIEKNNESNLNTTQQQIKFYKKISFNFTPLTASLLILPFSLSLGRPSYRKRKLSKAGICLVLSGFYWILFLSLINLGENEILSPLLATWGSHALSFVTSLILLQRLK